MVQYTGVNVEEAIQNGLKELDIPRMKAHITVVSREKKGFLGLFGKRPAVVDIEPIAETTVTKANHRCSASPPDLGDASPSRAGREGIPAPALACLIS